MLDQRSGTTDVVMPVSDLHGRTVWTEDGERIGTVRGVNTDDDGKIVSLDVRERWILGPHHEVPATGMRIDESDVVVPAAAVVGLERSRRHHSDDHDHHGMRGALASAPVLLSGREGARGRFGGLDLVGSFFGGLVTIASVVLIGGILAAVFGSDPANFDTSIASLESLLDEALVVGAVTLFVSCFLGGWCAGRSSRYDGVGNGLMSVVWVLAIAVALGALGAWVGDQYDVLAAIDVPEFTTDEFTMWGTIGALAALALMLLGGALGGALGESWHRRADRAMLDVVSVDGSDWPTSSTQQTEVIDDSDAVVLDRDGRRLE